MFFMVLLHRHHTITITHLEGKTMCYSFLCGIVAQLTWNTRKKMNSHRERQQMEQLNPCFRYLRGRVKHADQRRALQAGLAYLSIEDFQVELEVPYDDFLKQYTFASFIRYLLQNEHMQVWLAPHVLVTTEDRGSPTFQLTVWGTPFFFYQVDGAPVSELTNAVTLFVKLLTTAEIEAPPRRQGGTGSASTHSQHIKAIAFASVRRQIRVPVSTDALAGLIRDCDQFDSISFYNLQFNADQCAQLGGIQPRHSNLRLEIKCCHLDDPQAFGDGISNNGGPTHLSITTWMTSKLEVIPVLTSLANNTRLASLEITVPTVPTHTTNDGVPLIREPQALQLIKASLSQNKGLRVLKLFGNVMSDDGFVHICQALAYHPTMKRIQTESAWEPMGYLFSVTLPMKSIMIRLETVVEMLQTNTEIESIDLDVNANVSPLWQDVIVPLLQQNVYRKRFRALSKSEPESYRRALLAKALAKVSRDPQQLRIGLASNFSSFLFDLE